MNKELAKKLKDANFPQTGRGHFNQYWIGEQDGYMEEIYYPTLEEIIKECFGNAVNGNFKMREIHGFWEVSIYSGKKRKRVEVEAEEDLKIAVAKLWLKLNL